MLRYYSSDTFRDWYVSIEMLVFYSNSSEIYKKYLKVFNKLLFLVFALENKNSVYKWFNA